MFACCKRCWSLGNSCFRVHCLKAPWTSCLWPHPPRLLPLVTNSCPVMLHQLRQRPARNTESKSLKFFFYCLIYIELGNKYTTCLIKLKKLWWIWSLFGQANLFPCLSPSSDEVIRHSWLPVSILGVSCFCPLTTPPIHYPNTLYISGDYHWVWAGKRLATFRALSCGARCLGQTNYFWDGKVGDIMLAVGVGK